MTAVIANPLMPRPSGFSYAVTDSGPFVFLAGHTAVDADDVIVPGDIAAQFERALRNLLGTLAAAGTDGSALVSMTIYVTDIEAYKDAAARIGQIWQRHIGRHYPAMALVEVSRLWDRAARVEIQAVCAAESGRVTKNSEKRLP